ncbi:hypothetical protein [Novosphingobium guangzhouense]|uniref:Lipoprotein n=1 Tax=Novosphingobium guangzhouense TaxID=1850347 RepID=A0A2K2G533_9SPHN|nr:hypothetical protein [Novosphingobium guangzhouense]PNU06147.1 hypothetical protein A8V01_12360 [Novosphingobium guangzhouense]
MMLKYAVVTAAFAMLAGCGQETPAEQAAENARDVAMVERMSREPLKPIVPIPITAEDIDGYGLDRPGCSFAKQAPGAAPIFIATSTEGFMRVGRDFKRFAAKGTSADLPGGARTTYVGLSSWVDIVRLPDEGMASDANTWPARLIIHDSQERVAYRADGVMHCRGSDAPPRR